MARRKGGKSHRFKKAQAPPGRAVAQDDETETTATEAAPTATETPAPEPAVSEGAAQEGPNPQPEDGAARVEPEGTGPEAGGAGEPASGEPEEEEPQQGNPQEEEPEQGTPEREESTPEEVPLEADDASVPDDAPAQAEPDPALPDPAMPAGAPPAEAETAVVVPAEPQRPAAHVVEASTAAYGPEAVTPADLAVGREGVPSGHVEGKAAWRRLFRMSRPRTTKANVLAALLAIALGVGIATQVQLTNERGLSELSQSDLIRLLDDISARSNRLDAQVRELESRREALLNGTDSAAEALQQAQRRADTLGILAGTLAAQGPGITVSISDPSRQVSGPVILDLIQELRDAGAESIDVGGVRVVASSYVGDTNGDLSVDGTSISRPITVKAIGDSNTLASAMTIPGGIVETIRQKGANASVTESRTIEITSTHTPAPLTHAEPGQ
ncbi:MAG TPA: DUF881 domain-containing protein [Intrasporangium sp.]|jgi:Uncharacterized protein conserved in bacteria|uniref:DUF881 domain-containing protein n=1 Tax=Intrasporangium sp. TaxID=1925024 RepID=UPI002F9244AD